MVSLTMELKLHSCNSWCREKGSVKKFVSLEENDSFLVRITI